MTTGYLRTNITSLIAIFWTLFAGTLFVLVIIGNVKADEKVVYFVLGAVVSQVSTVQSYYFGSTKQAIPVPGEKTIAQSTTITEAPKVEEKKDGN